MISKLQSGCVCWAEKILVLNVLAGLTQKLYLICETININCITWISRIMDFMGKRLVSCCLRSRTYVIIWICVDFPEENYVLTAGAVSNNWSNLCSGEMKYNEPSLSSLQSTASLTNKIDVGLLMIRNVLKVSRF